MRLCALVALVACCAWPAAGCGERSTNVVSDRDGGFVDFADADPNAPDAGPNPGCAPELAECNNCEDDDGDGFVDGFDPECTGALDDREDSFSTGIPGDNSDEKTQDCFFDGNSGAGDDKCRIHTCCLLDGPCPPELQPPQFDPDKCAVSQTCIDNCAPLTPPGCDCFSCCTLCSGDQCFDVLTNPAVAPDCTFEAIDDPIKCPRCTKIDECGEGCFPLECILCPGQTEDDLPPECGGEHQCPAGRTPCTTSAECTKSQFCSNGCCIEGIG